MTLIRSPESAFYSLQMQSHGTQDIGEGQTLSGAIASAATFKNGEQTELTDVAHGLVKGQGILIAGTTSYNGPAYVVRVIGPDKFVIDISFVADESGTWNLKGAGGTFVAIQNLNGTALAMTTTNFPNGGIVLHEPGAMVGDLLSANHSLEPGAIMVFPGLIKQVEVAATGVDIRLIRTGGALKPIL